MGEKKMNKPLLYAMGFLCGRAVVLGIAPFIVPAFAAIYYMKKNTLGLLASALIGGATICIEVFETGPYVMPDAEISAAYFLTKYMAMIFVLLLGYNLLEVGSRRAAKNKIVKNRDRYFLLYCRKNTAVGVTTALIVFAVTFGWGLTVYHETEALLMALFEAIISVSMIPVFKRGFAVMVFDDRENDKYNEELLGVLALTAVCMWGLPVSFSGVVPVINAIGLYISWYYIRRYGAGYGMAVTGAVGVICAIRNENPELVGSFFVIAVIVLAGQIVCDKRKIGTVFFAAAACILCGMFYNDYFLTADGLKTAGIAVFILAATPKRLLSARDGRISDCSNAETAAEMNRITAEKIRELSGAFKRIEYTLAGCGPAAGRVSLSEVGEMIGRFSDNLSSAEAVPVNNEDLLKTKMLEQGVVISHLSTMKNEMNHRQYYVTARTKNKRIMLSKDAAEIMSEVFSQPIRVSADTPAIISENDRVIIFEESAKFKCSYCVRRIKKYGSNVCGDNFSVKEHEDGRLVLMISDGMGSGSLASCESTLMIDTMEEMMEAGFDPSYGIAFSNNCISEKNNGRSFTTFDMGVVDLYSGELTQYKQGAAPTYILHDNERAAAKTAAKSPLEVITGTTLPIGVLPETECDVVKTNLKDGDIIVMVSDGALDGGFDLTDILEGVANDDCREILDGIITEILHRSRGKLADDVTVIVAGMEENYEG